MNGGSLQKVALPLGESGTLISVLQMIVRGFPEHTEVLAPVPLASQIQVQLEQFVCLLCI
jgi:hypothetical protein